MSAKWGICVLLVAVLVLSSGCRTPQPKLKPEKTAEQLVDPPPNTYATSTYPKQAFSTVQDPIKANIDTKGAAGGMPQRGMMPTGGGGLGGR